MDDLEIIQKQHSAGPQSLGYDYQFYYFMYLALELKHGEQIGFEVKDDIHIDKADGKTILFQAKHTIITNTIGASQNLTTLDSDLWKTLSNWTDFIKKAQNSDIFLSKNAFCLVTNKSDENNDFLDCLLRFKSEQNIGNVLQLLNELFKKTIDQKIKAYIKNISSLSKKKLSIFLSNLNVETNINDIISKIKNKILERVMQNKFVEPVFECLSSNLHVDKYLEIEGRKKFIISNIFF